MWHTRIHFAVIPEIKVAGGKTNRMFSLQTFSLEAFTDRYIFVQTEVVSLRRLANMGLLFFIQTSCF